MQRKLNEDNETKIKIAKINFWGLLLVPIISSFVTYLVTKNSNSSSESQLHKLITMQASEREQELERKLMIVENDRKEIRLLFWKKEFSQISKYDNEAIENNINVIIKSFEKSFNDMNNE